MLMLCSFLSKSFSLSRTPLLSPLFKICNIQLYIVHFALTFIACLSFTDLRCKQVIAWPIIMNISGNSLLLYFNLTIKRALIMYHLCIVYSFTPPTKQYHRQHSAIMKWPNTIECVFIAPAQILIRVETKF